MHAYHFEGNNAHVTKGPKVCTPSLVLKFFIKTGVPVRSNNDCSDTNPASSGRIFASQKNGIQHGDQARRQCTKDNDRFDIADTEGSHIAVHAHGKGHNVVQIRNDVLPS